MPNENNDQRDHEERVRQLREEKTRLLHEKVQQEEQLR